MADIFLADQVIAMKCIQHAVGQHYTSNRVSQEKSKTTGPEPVNIVDPKGAKLSFPYPVVNVLFLV